MLSRKIRFPNSVIRQTTIQGRKYGAINLAQGFPDFDAPQEITRAGIQAIEKGFNQYSDPQGIVNLRKAISQKASHTLGEIDPENVVVTCGASEAMLATLLALLDPGDEVILFEPCYENYWAQLQIASASPRPVSLKAPDYTFDEEELAAAFTSDRVKAILLNTPNNPTGRVLTRRELETIAHLCILKNVIAISDEIYEHIVYDNNKHISIAILDGMRERTVTINSLSKTYSVTGWRIGYAIAPQEILAGIQKVHNFTTAAAPTPFQQAGVTALTLGNDFYEQLRQTYDQKRQLLFDILQDVGFRCRLPQGSYYIMADFSPFGFESDLAFCDYLITKVGVAAVPATAFYLNKALGNNWIRFTFSKDFPTLEEASRRLKRLKA